MRRKKTQEEEEGDVDLDMDVMLMKLVHIDATLAKPWLFWSQGVI